MAASGEYRIIEAETLASRKRRRIFLEEALQKSGLSAQRRLELEWALKQARVKEMSAQQAADEETDEEKEKKKTEGEGEAGGDQKGSAGGSAGGGVGSDDSETVEEESGLSYLEMFELLILLAETEVGQHQTPSSDPLATATILFDREEKTAQINDPYLPEYDHHNHSIGTFLPSLEQHAATALGAHVMHLNVHADAIELFRKKFGYEPISKGFQRKGAPLQRMRKSLAQAQILKNNVT